MYQKVNVFLRGEDEMTSSINQRQFEEKRTDIRHPCQKHAEVFIGARRFSGCIRNESKGGVFVETRGSFLLNDNVVVVYASPLGIDLRRSGKIVKLEPGGIGVKFKWPGYNE
jgi:hypothetical protein